MSRRVPARCAKVRYANQTIAEEAAARFNEKRARRGEPLQRIYRCPECGGLHLTTSPIRPIERTT